MTPANLDKIREKIRNREKYKPNSNSRLLFGHFWEFLEARHADAFVISDGRGAEKEVVADTALAMALAQFFPEDGKVSYTRAYLERSMPGTYIMYRPYWQEPSGGLFEMALVEIEIKNGDIQIFITQDFPENDPIARDYKQIDGGILFPYRRYIYFLTKEIDGKGNFHTVKDDQTTVRLGVIYNYIAVGGKHFEGVMFAASNTDIYPALKFFCRIAPPDGRSFKARPMRLEEIPDDHAKAFLKNAIVSTKFFGTR